MSETALKLRLLEIVRSDWIFRKADALYVAPAGVYEGDTVKINPHGAVSVLTPGGWLGIKPAEMVWLNQASADEQQQRAGADYVLVLVRVES